MNPEVKREKRTRRHHRVRAKVRGSQTRPRLSVFRSNRHLYLQLIDDQSGRTIVQASTKEPLDFKGKSKLAEAVGKLLSLRAAKAGISEVVFDRGGYKYHGRVMKVAEAARKAGLKF